MPQSSSIIYLATNNSHKITEISAIIGTSWQLRTLAEISPPLTWEETGTTFLENAMIKIDAARQKITGPLLAEDSGLCVDALGGVPGVVSSCYAGVEGDHPGNCAKLLAALEKVPPGKRGASFVCTVVYADADDKRNVFVGECRGKIIAAMRGQGGFGYDPLFVPSGMRATMAELSAAEKNRISHRYQAFTAWMNFMKT